MPALAGDDSLPRGPAAKERDFSPFDRKSKRFFAIQAPSFMGRKDYGLLHKFFRLAQGFPLQIGKHSGIRVGDLGGFDGRARPWRRITQLGLPLRLLVGARFEPGCGMGSTLSAAASGVGELGA
jgi:hypothetical protein